MAKDDKKTDEITELNFKITGEENIKQFALLVSGGLQARGMAVLEVITEIKKQVNDQTGKKII